MLTALYPWIKAAHIVAVMAWMAGMLYLPRLYVYHATAAIGSELSETLKTMERRLLRAIINPAMIASYLFGGLLLLVPGVVEWGAGWIYAKLAAVAALTYVHHWLARRRQDFAADRNVRSAKFYRLANEIPTLLLIAIVVLVTVKPF